MAELEHWVWDPPLMYSATDTIASQQIVTTNKQCTTLFLTLEQSIQIVDHVAHAETLPSRSPGSLTCCGVWIGDKVSRSDLGNSMPFLFISS